MENKTSVIELLAGLPFQRITKTFVEIYKRLTEGIEPYDKLVMIKTMLNTPVRRLMSINDELKEEIMDSLKSQGNSFSRKWLIYDLCIIKDEQERLERIGKMLKEEFGLPYLKRTTKSRTCTTI